MNMLTPLVSTLVTSFATDYDRKYSARPTKQCLECGTLHQHNNSWCSAACCKEWRAKQ